MSELRDMFGPRKEAVWKILCEEIGGDFVNGGPWDGGKVVVKVEGWTITLDIRKLETQHDTIFHTRFRAPYVNKDGFRFTIYRQGLFQHFSKLFGMQDIEIGNPELDSMFIFQGNDTAKVKEFFAHEQVREVLMKEPDIRMSVKDDAGWFSDAFPEGVDELNLKVEEVVTDIERLKSLYDLFSVSLHHLCHIGSAYNADPKIDLE